MMLRQSKGRYDPKDIEGVLPVLDRCLYDGGDGGVVLNTDLSAEASTDLEFVQFGVGSVGLCRTGGLARSSSSRFSIFVRTSGPISPWFLW